jgi:hypothetical protein
MLSSVARRAADVTDRWGRAAGRLGDDGAERLCDLGVHE